MPATPVARVHFIPSILPNTQNPMLPPTVGDILLTAVNNNALRVLADYDEVLPDDSKIIVEVEVLGPPAFVYLQNRRTPRGTGVTQWNTANPPYVVLNSTGTWHLTFTITGDSLNSQVTNFTAVKQP